MLDSATPSDRSGKAIRPSTWSKSTWVASSATGSNPDWPSTAGSSSSSSGKYGESMSMASSPARSATALSCQNRLVTTRASSWTATALIGRSAPQAAPRSWPASRKLLTSSVGFFWPDSSA